MHINCQFRKLATLWGVLVSCVGRNKYATLKKTDFIQEMLKFGGRKDDLKISMCT